MRILVENQHRGIWQAYHEPKRLVSAQTLEDVLPALAEVERAVEKEGLYAAGFLTYEAAPALDRAFRTARPGALPLLQFGLYSEFHCLTTLPEPAYPDTCADMATEWAANISEKAYWNSIERIKNDLSAGNSYQVNYSFRLRRAAFTPGMKLFRELILFQGQGYSAWVDADDFRFLSASPELFFALCDGHILTMPMKGTRPRGRWLDEDHELAQELRSCAKERAENVMIVDMMRNDLGRIARPGSVQVAALLAVQRRPTVQQMTSTVQANTDAGLVAILQALFPCASITGAPKIKTMEIIAREETSPRGIYTGAIGFYHPQREALFNVAIRTLHVDKRKRVSEYGVGGGIVWDSAPGSEYQECFTKSQILTQRPTSFYLLETLLWLPEAGFFLQDQHIQRLAQSAEYFGFSFSLQRCKTYIGELVETLRRDGGIDKQRVRLLLDRPGVFRWESAFLQADFVAAPSPEAACSQPALTAAMAQQPVDSRNPFLFHKTTQREIYELRARPSYDTTILHNERGELTECLTANLVLRYGSLWLTPERSCGLLAGTYRQALLETGKLQEARLTLQDLRQADEVFQINSVRLWTRLKVQFD